MRPDSHCQAHIFLDAVQRTKTEPNTAFYDTRHQYAANVHHFKLDRSRIHIVIRCMKCHRTPMKIAS